MANKKNIIKPKVITAAMQLTKILKEYNNVKSHKLEKDILNIVMEIKATQSSKTYNVKIRYKLGEKPVVIVTNIEEGTKLPHTYLNNNLCLYYPKSKEWSKYDYISDTIIPWISEWLYFYEIWLATDKWLGGGLHPE